ncbi:MFS transporter, partial [Klebsiella quasipneumoniae subsp. similipneumoniae]
IPWTVYTFLADVDEIYTGRRREGIYAGAMTFSGKILRSIVVFSMGAILSFYGFQSKAHSQPESAVTAIAVVFCVGVVALALAAIVFSKQMKLDRKAHLVVLQEVARIKAGGKISDIAPEVRAIVEDLVGHRYEECWGNSKLFKTAEPAPVQTVVSH